MRAVTAATEENPMKKLFTIMLCALLTLIPALAEGSLYTQPGADDTYDLQEIFDILLPEADATPEPQSGSDEPEHSTSTGETFAIDYHGHNVTLDFDASPQYSSVADGLVQASFYKYDGDNLFELFVVFSASAAPGLQITPDYAALDRPETSIVLIVSDTKTYQEQYYMASLMDGASYPKGSDFMISIDEIQDLDGKVSYVGRLSGTLIALDMATGEVADTLSVPETPFAFTIGGSAEGTPAQTPTKAPNDERKV